MLVSRILDAVAGRAREKRDSERREGQQDDGYGFSECHRCAPERGAAPEKGEKGAAPGTPALSGAGEGRFHW
jgi:hypothetical protein